MRKKILVAVASMLLAACGTSSSLTAPTHNPLEPEPPVFDPGNSPPPGTLR